eukprot:Seg5293.4 transcript_id=Seg5293.4/GoldUCD/mRNA.D3Y31 product="hypothetical protein" protein_id=Seg5293.4/GoldUCD/D3Y31
MSRKNFSLLETTVDFQKSIELKEQERESKWNLCFICQVTTQESLMCPATNSRQLDKSLGYKSIVEQLKKFEEIGELPDSIHCRIHFACQGNLAEKLLENEAKFHKQCKNRYDDQHYQRACKKRKLLANDEVDSISPPSTRARFSAHNFVPRCFFCEKEDTHANLTQAQTFCLDKRVRDAATQLQDEKILAKLSAGDMIAVEAVYHKACLVTLYNRLRNFKNPSSKEESEHAIVEGIVLVEILDYIRDTHRETLSERHYTCV